MSSLRIIQHYPSINELDIPRNPKIQIYFDKALNQGSINYGIMSLNDMDYAPISGYMSIAYTNSGTPSGVANILTFAPSVLLSPNTEYTVYMYPLLESIKSVDNSYLSDSYKFSFTTGSDILDPNHISYSYNDKDRLLLLINNYMSQGDYTTASTYLAQLELLGSSGTLPQDDYVEPTVVSNLAIVSSYPMSQQPNIDLNLRFIKLSFNDVPNTSGIDLRDYITVTHNSVLQ